MNATEMRRLADKDLRHNGSTEDLMEFIRLKIRTAAMCGSHQLWDPFDGWGKVSLDTQAVVLRWLTAAGVRVRARKLSRHHSQQEVTVLEWGPTQTK